MQHSTQNLHQTDRENEQRLLAETLQEVTLVFASQTDPSAVLDEILYQAQRLVPFKTSNITLLEDDGTLRVVRSRGYRDVGSDAFIASLVQHLSELPLDRQVIESRKPLVIADVHNEPNWVVLPETSWIRSILVVPIWWADQVLGLLRFDSAEPDTFTEKDAEYLQPLANAAAIALQNASLLDKVQRHAAHLEERVAERTAQLEKYSKRQAALAEFELAINLPQELEGVLNKAVQLTVKFLPDITAACIIAKNLELEVLKCCAEEISGPVMQLIEQKIYQQTVEQTDPIIVSNVQNDSSDVAQALAQTDVRAYVSLPLVQADEVLGILVAVSRQPYDYTPEDIDFLAALANRASVAITKVHLYRQLADAKEAAEAASRAKSEFLANMTHELRTPLSSIIGFTEILLEQNFGPLNKKQKKYTGNILNSSQRLLELITDILDLTKVEAGRMPVDPMPFNPTMELNNALKPVQPLAANKEQALILEIKETLPTVTADLAIVRKVMHHLLTNAIKYTPAKGAITVRVTVTDQTGHCDASLIESALCISVTDTGIGLDEGEMERVFSVFEQLDAAYNRQQQGTGIGLALTKRLVELQGGCIWVTSQGPGQGSTFTFTVPLENKVVSAT